MINALESDSYKKLLSLTENGALEILLILSPPRTGSTVMEVALTEWGHGQIHEPFHKYGRRTFEDGCNNILRRVSELQKTHTDEKIKLVVKDLSKHLKTVEWEQISKLTSKFVFVIRDPVAQIYSLVRKRSAVLGLIASNATNEKLLTAMKTMSPDRLEDSSWATVRKQFESVQNLPGNKIAVLSTTTLRSNPSSFLEKLTERMGLDIESVDTITSSWHKATNENFKFVPSEEGKYQGSLHDWVSQAVSSTEFTPINENESVLGFIDQMPKSALNSFLEKTLPTYLYFMESKENVTKLTKRATQKNGFLDSPLAKVFPLEALVQLLAVNEGASGGNAAALIDRIRQLAPSTADALINAVLRHFGQNKD